MLNHCYLILFQLMTIFPSTTCRISVGKKIIYSYFEWINKRIEPIYEEEINLTNYLINLKIEINSY